MTSRRAAGVMLAAAVLMTSPTAAAQDVRSKRIADVDFGAGIAVHPDGRIFVTEREGNVRVIDENGLDAAPVASIPTTIQGETGLLGITVDPSGRFLYMFATSADGAANRVWRVGVDGGEPEIVVDGLPAAVYHNGGGIAFDASGMLLVSNGEQHTDDRAQDPETLGGKVYRYTPEGGVPSDNPFGNSPAFAIGLRNPYGLTVDPATGAIYATENGPSSFDEVERIEAGANYGWPDISGPAGGARPRGPGAYRDPLVAYENIIVPTGIAVADRSSAQPQYRGDIFFGAYGEGTIHRLRLDASGNVGSDDVFIDVGEPVIGVAWGPEGLYYATTSAVYVAPIGTGRRAPARPRTPTPGVSSFPPPTTTRGRSPDGDGFRTAAIVVLVAVLAGGAAYVVARRARRRR